MKTIEYKLPTKPNRRRIGKLIKEGEVYNEPQTLEMGKDEVLQGTSEAIYGIEFKIFHPDLEGVYNELQTLEMGKDEVWQGTSEAIYGVEFKIFQPDLEGVYNEPQTLEMGKDEVLQGTSEAIYGVEFKIFQPDLEGVYNEPQTLEMGKDEVLQGTSEAIYAVEFKIFQSDLERRRGANVVQVVADNAPVCKVAGLLVEAKYPHIFWTPYVMHTLNLALKNICAPTNSLQYKEAFDECKWIAEVANDASMIKNFIMNHNMRLSMFNDNSNLKMLSFADTRFASTIIMLKRFRQIKKCLENMVISERWDLYKEDDVVKARVVKYKILDDQFWVKIDYILAFTSSIYEMLRKADTGQPSMSGSSSEHRSFKGKEKKCIERYYSNSSKRRSVNEEFAAFSTAIDDFSDNDSMRDRGLMSPAKWWVIHGASTPTLQSLALKLLGHPSSSSCCERN
ncbi:hypothetical protein ZIOFF_060197 [Zingiber officinale]|uniref:DUF659 domain-containing protein n=1 Tax=Zingiber officinale TaxID=94328 RepID=A0A8J5FN46_ZINOF|nr:hypothetical protein ZIOFF_060197 [Zingiber officinale]